MLKVSDSITEGDVKYSRFSNTTRESRTFFQRTLGKIEAGALRAAIFTLISTLIGAGCLTLPLVFSKQGIILGILLMILSSLCSYVGIMNITTAAEDYKVYEYSGLVEKVLGIWWKRVFDNTMILAVLGTLIGYQVMVGFFLTSIFKSLNFNFDEDFLRIIVMVAANLVIMMPLGLMRTLTSLRFMSIFSALTLTYIALLIICEFPFFVEHNEYEGNVNIFEVNLSVISSFNICMYAFNCHANVAQVYDELQRRNLRRMEKVATRALISVFFPFLALGIFGYLSTLDNTPTLIVMRRAPSHISNDWPMVIARGLMSITLTIAVPINIPPGRRIIIKSWLKNHDEVPSLKM
jgi:amino acid permease